MTISAGPFDEYQPGVCNIGPAEVRLRRRSGTIALAIATGLALLLWAMDVPRPLRLLVAIPLASGFGGLLQARLRFCAGYGFAGRRNLGAIGAVERVASAADRRTDRRMALRISAASFAGAALLAVLFAVLPLPVRRG